MHVKLMKAAQNERKPVVNIDIIEVLIEVEIQEGCNYFVFSTSFGNFDFVLHFVAVG